jgi:hypothetical protein
MTLRPRQLPAHEIICLCGQRGMGKSEKAKEIAAPLVRVAFFDELAEYAEAMGGPVISIDEFERRERARVLSRGVLRVSVRPTSYDPKVLPDQFDRFCAVCLRVGAMTVGVEEVSLVASPSEVPPRFAQLLAIGRHRACSAIVLGQRFAQFPRLATAMATQVYAFRQVEPSDLNDLEKRIGKSVATAADGMAVPTEHAARSLPRFSYIHWTPEEGGKIVHGARRKAG